MIREMGRRQPNIKAICVHVVHHKKRVRNLETLAGFAVSSASSWLQLQDFIESQSSFRSAADRYGFEPIPNSTANVLAYANGTTKAP